MTLSAHLLSQHFSDLFIFSYTFCKGFLGTVDGQTCCTVSVDHLSFKQFTIVVKKKIIVMRFGGFKSCFISQKQAKSCHAAS